MKPKLAQFIIRKDSHLLIWLVPKITKSQFSILTSLFASPLTPSLADQTPL